MKVDIVGVCMSDGRQVVFLEMSSAPTDFLNTHTMGDFKKELIQNRFTLKTIFLRGKKDYVDEEEMSVVFPLSWELLSIS
uniref:Uncharacterized protein n=1 Tax=Rhizophagus irregularis (strain DAOM 181602 / DAOM 197198 / MUCL 43194) TaxID=747089 RepID=U9U6T8_RHIID